MVSHDALRTREDAEAAVPAVSGFPFDLSAPCYLSPMLQQKRDGGILSGFMGCDVLLNGKLELNHVAPFINKCRSINSLPSTGKCLFMFIADEYSKDAFQALKTQGIIPATVDNLFSQETAKALRMLGELLVWLSLPSPSSSFELSTLEEIMTQLSHIAGATQQLQGDLFEYIVAQAVSVSVRDVRLGVSCRLDDGKRADCDVLAQEGHKRIRFIECKGYRPYSEVLHKDVLHWINRQVPVFHKYACSIDPKIDIQVEFWTTGKLSEESLNSLKNFKDNNSLRSRYKIIIKDAYDVHECITLTRDPALIRVFEKHFIDTFKKEPLASKNHLGDLHPVYRSKMTNLKLFLKFLSGLAEKLKMQYM